MYSIVLLYFFSVGLYKSVQFPFVKRILSATPFLIVLIRRSTIFACVLVVFCTIPNPSKYFLTTDKNAVSSSLNISMGSPITLNSKLLIHLHCFCFPLDECKHAY